MLKILLGYITHDLSETPEILFHGHDGDELEAAVAKVDPSGFVRLAKIDGAMEIPVAMPESIEGEVEDIFQDVDEASDSIESEKSSSKRGRK